MKIFLKKVLVFCSIIVSAVLLALVVSTKAVSAYFPYEFDDNITTIVLGDSHLQCGINDGMLPNAKNLCEGSDTYFHAYVKFKKLLAHNPQIDTLVLGYSYHNIEINQDVWLSDSSLNRYKIPLYFFMFEYGDIESFSQLNSEQLIEAVPKIIKKNVLHLYRIAKHYPISWFEIGAYKSISHQISEKERREAVAFSDNSPILHATVDIAYLKKIYALCESSRVKLILVSTPVLHNRKKNPHFGKRYWQYASENLANATVMNFIELNYPPTCYADSGHLNSKGAERFTSMLQSKLSGELR